MKGHNCSCKSRDSSYELSPRFTLDIHVVTLGLNHNNSPDFEAEIPRDLLNNAKAIHGSMVSVPLEASEMRNSETRIFEGHFLNSQRTGLLQVLKWTAREIVRTREHYRCCEETLEKWDGC